MRARSLKPARTISLHGDFSFDALSPGGRRLFLIQHAYAQNLARYAVRVSTCERPAGREGRGRQGRAQHGGLRHAPRDGARLALGLHALQRGGNGGYFIHALDTVGVRAVCIDLPATTDPDALGRSHLVADPSGQRLDVVGADGKTLYSIDLRTFKVTKAVARPRYQASIVGTSASISRQLRR